MELRQLEYFVAVAEELSFTKAARRLRLVQSGVSTAIRALEREVGAPLFERDSRHVRLSDAGAAMLPSARAALAAVQSAHDAVQAGRGELRGSIVFGSMLSTPGIDVPAILGRFHRDHPAVRIRLTYSPRGSDGHVRSLLDGSLDLALASFPRKPPAGLHVEVLTDERLRLVCGPGHPLAEVPEVRPADLAEHTFADFAEGWGTRGVVDLAFDRLGLTRSIPLETPDYATTVALARQGHVVAFLPESVARAEPDLIIVPVRGESLSWNVGLASSATKPVSRATRVLMAAIRDAVGRENG